LLGCSSIGNVWSDFGAAQQAPAFALSNFCKAKDNRRGAPGPQMPDVGRQEPVVKSLEAGQRQMSEI
jgi:hypothetical protein